MSKFWVNFTGFFFFCMLLLGMYFINWTGQAHHYNDQIPDNIERLRSSYDAMEGINVRFKPDSVVETGFPFSYKIRMYKPEFRMSVGDHFFYLSTAYVDFIPVDDDEWSYQVEIPHEVIISYKQGQNQQEVYPVYFSNLPQMWLRRSTDKNDPGKSWNEYGVQLPSTMTMDVAVGQNNKRAGWQFPNVGQPTWHYIPARIDLPVRYLTEMVRAVARR